MIVVTGATGKIGSELVRLLAERGETVRALARHAGRGAVTPNVEWAAADLARREQLPSIFTGAEKLFLLTANSEDMVRLQKNAIAAARQAGVRHVVKLSALGASDHSKSVIGLWHYNVERVLLESGLAWTVLRPHHFMDNLLDQRENIVRDGIVYSAAGEGRIPFIDTRDIAAVAAVALTEPGHEAKEYVLTGPEALSYRRATEILSGVLGRPLESIASNLASAAAAKAQMARSHPGATSFDDLHALDYLEYAYLQLGDDRKAREVLDEVAKASRFDDPNFAAGYALVAVPARYALERRDWRAAAALTAPAAELPWERFSYARGITSFANVLGAARLGDLDRARKGLADLETLHAALVKEPPAGPYDWAGNVDAMRLAAAGWVAFAEGRKEEAVKLLTAAADKEDAVGKHPVTPGAVLPAREQLGDLLLELGKPREALAAYEASLAGAPKRFNGLAGAARAAELAGEPSRARGFYQELLTLCGASCERPEAQRARKVVSG
jgi:uncharacterized protein YbjT (DUF2867 family)